MLRLPIFVSLALLSFACSASPEATTSPRRSPSKQGADSKEKDAKSDDAKSDDSSEDESSDPEIKDPTENESEGSKDKPSGNESKPGDDASMKPTTPIDSKPPETMTPETMKPEPMVPALNTPPPGCTGTSSVGASDIVLYDGEAKEVKNNAIVLNTDWTFNDSWGNGKMGVEAKGTRSVITFTGETIYNGFKFTPGKNGNKRKTFIAKSVDIFVSSNKAAQATFGLRIIKPNEDEGNGAAPTTSWYKLAKDSNDADNKMIPAPVVQDCKLVTYHIGKVFLDQNKVSDRLIWEMMTK